MAFAILLIIMTGILLDLACFMGCLMFCAVVEWFFEH
jgi:hypothetical protein